MTFAAGDLAFAGVTGQRAAPPLAADPWSRLGGVGTALAAGRWMPWAPPFNVTGQPALALPAGTDPDGVPLTVHLAAGAGRDALLLAVAAQLEAARPWASVHPALA